MIQRLLVGSALVYSAAAAPSGDFTAAQVIGGLSGVLLIAGLWTPVAGVVAGCAEVWIALSSPAHIWNCSILVVWAVTLALIGPGAWSIDARLYGRKHYAPPPL